MQVILGQAEACFWDTMPYCNEKLAGIFYMHYLIDMVTHDFGIPVGVTMLNKAVTYN